MSPPATHLDCKEKPAESFAAALSCRLSNRQTTVAKTNIWWNIFLLRLSYFVQISVESEKSEYKIRAAFVAALIAVCPLLVCFG